MKISNSLLVYFSFLRVAFLKMLAYRLRYYTGIFTYTLYAAVQYFIWKAVFANYAAGQTIHGYTLSEMVTYVTIAWICRSLYFSNIDDEIDDLVRSGQISIYLIRPVNFQVMLFSHAAGESIFRLLCFSPFVALSLYLFFPMQPPASGLAFILFAWSNVVAFLILASINFLVGLCSFVFQNIEGLSRAKYMVIQLLSGLLIPLPFFPESIRSVVESLPFKYITYAPMQCYLGKISGDEIVRLVSEQITWLALLWTAGYLAWSAAARKLCIQGG